MKQAMMTMVLVAVLATLGAGCAAPVRKVDMRNDDTAMGMALDYRDIREAAGKVLAKISAQGVLDHPGGGRYVMAIGYISCSTYQQMDPSMYTQAIKEALMDAGKVVISARKHADGTPDADFELTGKIFDSAITLGNGERRNEHYLQLTLTDLRTGYEVFASGAEPITKVGSRKASLY